MDIINRCERKLLKATFETQLRRWRRGSNVSFEKDLHFAYESCNNSDLSVCLSLSELSQKWLFQTLFTYKINNSPVQLITAFGGMDSLRAGSLVWIGYRGQRWESRNRELARRMGRGKVKTTMKATHSNTNPRSGQYLTHTHSHIT